MSCRSLRMEKYLTNFPFVRYFSQCVTTGLPDTEDGPFVRYFMEGEGATTRLPNTEDGQMSHNLPFVRYFMEGEGEGEGDQLEVSQPEFSHLDK